MTCDQCGAPLGTSHCCPLTGFAVDRALYELGALCGRLHDPTFRDALQKRLIWNDTLRRRARSDVERLRNVLADAAFGEDDFPSLTRKARDKEPAP